MEQKKQKLVIDGNAFYELDLECMERKKKEREAARQPKPRQQQGQRN